MKKVIAIVLSFVLLCAALAGCGAGGGSAPASPDSAPPPGGVSSGRGDSAMSERDGSPGSDTMPEPSAPDDYYTSESTYDDSFDSATSVEPAEDVSADPESQARPQLRPSPGQLTAGEWDDNDNYDFILNLVQTNDEWRSFETRWQFNISGRVTAVVTDDGTPINNAVVELLDNQGNTVFVARTNNAGVAYLFAGLRTGSQDAATHIRAGGAQGERRELDPSVNRYEFSLPGNNVAQSLDLMFVIDTTGSMGDELDYIKAELDDVIRQVRRDNANIDVRLSVNVYRDFGDEYVVRSMPFERDIENQLAFLRRQAASGGGDWEEAVHVALDDALSDHDWNDSATAKLLFLVLDAPPHNTDSIRNEMHRLYNLSASMGVRIIPVASSGIDKITEFLLRAMSITTGGTYIFLTDHSGIGNPHIEPTIGDYNVELLNELMIRVINNYLA